MQVTTAFRQIRKIKDDRFEEENIHDYSLLLNLGVRDLQVAVLQQSRLLYLEDFIFPSVTSTEELRQALLILLEQHAFLKAGFWKDIGVAVKNQKFIQVPEPLFDADASAQYLRFNANVNLKAYEIHQHTLGRSQAVTVFAMPKIWKQVLAETYPNGQYRLFHHSSALIEGVMQLASSDSENPLYVFVDRFKFHILYARDGKLIYYNQFSIHNFQDYIKYIMLVMNSLHINQQMSKVVMWGYLGNNSPHYHEFYKYVQNVSFGSKPAHLQYGYVFDEIQDHQYFDLLSMSLL
ncbi:MAG: DUF3822 family protein [Cyclobacteriaceae bacterium]|nr:DUF3822 family protein [Cyclobacteriaceae bacterium]